MSSRLINSAVLTAIIGIMLLLNACSGGSSQTLEQQKLFSLSIGKMEDQLDIYYDGVSAFNDEINVYMKEGIIFIADSRGRKVMRFSSYGDLLGLFYNKSENPEPVLLQDASDDAGVSSRKALAFPFERVGEIAVSDAGLLYVEDSIPEARAEYDDKNSAHLNRIVRRFDLSGNYIDYLGQEGVGGTPFPYIDALHINEARELIVVSRAERSWLVFWFTAEGSLKYKITIPLTDLPAPDEPGIVPALERVVPDVENDLLYVKIDTYKEVKESLAGTGMKIDYFASYFFRLNPATGEYEGSIEIPHVIRKQEVPGLHSGREEEVLHEFLGIAKGGFFFLLGPFGPDEYQILILDRTGSVIDSPKISIQDSEIFYREFHLNSDGVLMGILCREFSADIVWWRTDKIIENRINDEAN